MAEQTYKVICELPRLKCKQSAALVLRHHHGHTNREIAAALGVSERTVVQRVADALDVLRALRRIVTVASHNRC